MEIKSEKANIRKLMLDKRKEIGTSVKAQYDKYICQELEQIIQENNFKVVHAYIPIANEINILPLINKLLKNNITVVCPKTLTKRRLENRVLVSLTKLEMGIMQTLHPKEPLIYEGKYDLVIVPGLAFDKANYRVGYGGGYYDNFLIDQPDALKVGIFYPFQMIDSVPLEPHDVRLDLILSKEF